jgi:cytochrome b pre-mRNA-processing protein 3
VLAWLKRTLDRSQTARKLYGSSVTQARQPAFYADWGVPDTPQGRFEMLVLHLALAVDRLAREGPAGQRLALALNETFVDDMDAVMREMTFSDLAVPREIKQVAAALLDRHQAYAQALSATQGDALDEALSAQLGYLAPAKTIDMRALAGYMRRAVAALDAEPPARVLGGQIAWPAPRHGKED